MKAKPVLVIVVILAIGFVLGMLTSAQIRLHKLRPVRVYYSEEKFREGFFQIIQPDGEQKAKINAVLDKYARINSELQDNFRKSLEENMNEFRKELDQNLTKEQLNRIKEMDERREQMIRRSIRERDDTSNNRYDRRHDERRSAPDNSQEDKPPPPPPE